MRLRWLWIANALAAISGLAGCATSGPNLKTPMAERFALPPTDDPRFSEPMSYPKDTLNQDNVIKPTNSKLPSQTPPLTGGQPGGVGGAGGRYAGPNL